MRQLQIKYIIGSLIYLSHSFLSGQDYIVTPKFIYEKHRKTNNDTIYLSCYESLFDDAYDTWYFYGYSKSVDIEVDLEKIIKVKKKHRAEILLNCIQNNVEYDYKLAISYLQDSVVKSWAFFEVSNTKSIF